jgi:hypothetical protein
MSDTAIPIDDTPVRNSGYRDTLSLIVAAGGTTLGLGSFATLFGVSLNEQLYRFVNGDLTVVQAFISGLFQAAFALFLVQPDVPKLLAGSRKLVWYAASVAAGIVLVIWLSEYAHQLLSAELAATRPERPPGAILFGSSFWHATIWTLHAIIIAAMVETFIFQGFMFHSLRDLPLWIVCCAVLFFFAMAGGYASGFDGIWENLKLGCVLVALRIGGGSFTYPAVAAIIYRGIDQFAYQWLTLP